jgi:single-strand DNA-binding protein
MSATTTVIGNLTNDPELRFTNAGDAQVLFSVAENKQWKNRSGETETATSYFDCSLFGQQAQNFADTFHKGDRVIVHGHLNQRTWETPEGDKRSKIELKVVECGPSIKWATAGIERNPRDDDGASGDRFNRRSSTPAPSQRGNQSAYAFDEEPF